MGSSTSVREACTSLSIVDGIPSLLTFPGWPGLGINRSRTGSGVNVRALSCSRVSDRKAAVMCGLAATRAGATRSTPAVRAPLFPFTRSHATVRKSG